MHETVAIKCVPSRNQSLDHNVPFLFCQVSPIFPDPVVLEIKHRVLHMVGKYSTTQVYPYPFFFLLEVLLPLTPEYQDYRSMLQCPDKMKFKKIKTTHYYQPVCAHTCGNTHVTACVWRSEENPWSLFSPSTSMWILGLERRLSPFYGKCLYPLSHINMLTCMNFLYTVEIVFTKQFMCF